MKYRKMPFTVLALCAAVGCGAPRPPTSTALADPRCQGGLEPAERAPPMAMGDVPEGLVAEVALEGLVTVPEGLVRELIEVSVGAPLDLDLVRADITRILALEAFEDVEVRAQAAPSGIVVRYRVFERPLVGEVRVLADQARAASLHLLVGELYSPQRVFRARRRLLAELLRDGYPEAVVAIHAFRVRPERVGVCVTLQEGRRWQIDQVVVRGAEQIDDSDLLGLMDGFEGRVNTPGGIYRQDLLDNARLHMTALYYDRGMLEVVIEEPRLRWHDDRLVIEVEVAEGPVYHVGAISMAGTPRATSEEHLALVDLESGDIFSRKRFMVVIERMKQLERSRGHEVEIVPEVEMDSERHLVDVQFVVGERATQTESTGVTLGESEPSLSLDSQTLSLDPSLGQAL